MSRYQPHSVCMLLIAALLASPLALFCQRAQAQEEKVKKTELHKKMEVIDEGMKKLKRSIRKADENPESIKVCGEIIAAATACRDLVPSKAGKLSDEDKKKFIDGYQKSMTKLIDTMGEMKKALEAGDNDKAKALHKALKDQEEDGHDKFMDDDNKEKGDKPAK